MDGDDKVVLTVLALAGVLVCLSVFVACLLVCFWLHGHRSISTPQSNTDAKNEQPAGASIPTSPGNEVVEVNGHWTRTHGPMGPGPWTWDEKRVVSRKSGEPTREEMTHFSPSQMGLSPSQMGPPDMWVDVACGSPPEAADKLESSPAPDKLQLPPAPDRLPQQEDAETSIEELPSRGQDVALAMGTVFEESVSTRTHFRGEDDVVVICACLPDLVGAGDSSQMRDLDDERSQINVGPLCSCTTTPRADLRGDTEVGPSCSFAATPKLEPRRMRL